MSTETRINELMDLREEMVGRGEAAPAEEFCRDCPELAGELERRIEALREVDRALGSTGGDEAAPESTPPGRPAGPLPEVGPAVSSYVPIRFHAAGGVGEVYLTWDERLGREVALKLIQHRRARSPEALRRFLREAEVTGRLEHPGIAPVYAVGASDDGRPYYAMRFVRGETLREAIDRHHSVDRPDRLGLRLLLGRFVEVCNTVAYAHSRGVLHRDLKPSNVILGEYGETIVVDWGLAKVFGPGEGGAVDLPAREATPGDPAGGETVGVMGSPGYMSPEQAEGDWGRVGPASDVYSLGATLYCLLAGRPPSDGPGLAEAIRRSGAGDFPPPRRVNPAVPAALEAVCLKAMALRPGDRYASPRGLAGDVERWLAGEPVSARPEPWHVRGWRRVSRHRTLAASSAVALLAVLIGAGVALQEARLRSERRLAGALGLVEALRVADLHAVPELARRLDPDLDLVAGPLRAMARGVATGPPSTGGVAAAIALLRVDSSTAGLLVDRLVRDEETPDELAVIRRVLVERARPADVSPRVWDLLRGGPRSRSEFVHLLPSVEADPAPLVRRLLDRADGVGPRRAMVLALGGYRAEAVEATGRRRLVDSLLEDFRSSPDPGLRSAVDWALGRRWGLARVLREAQEGGSPPRPDRDWFVDGQGQTLAVVRGPVEFPMGSPDSEPGRRPGAETRHRRRIERSFAIATREVTRGQYRRFLDDNPGVFRPDDPDRHLAFGRYMPDDDCPVVGVSCFEAIRYCNWLSLREGLPESEWCYPKEVDPDRPLALAPDYLARAGYRLPTEAEWECGARGGTETARPFGDSAAWIGSYAWFMENSGLVTHPVGSKMPNDLGLFDVLGNVTEWTFQTLEPSKDYPVEAPGAALLDRELAGPIAGRVDFMLRGGSFYYPPPNLRSANRNWNKPTLRENTIGFRVARTVARPAGRD